jgi:hypothetical protein
MTLSASGIVTHDAREPFQRYGLFLPAQDDRAKADSDARGSQR